MASTPLSDHAKPSKSVSWVNQTR